MTRALLAIVFLAGCSSSDPAVAEAPADTATDAGCTAPRFLVYPRAGCNGSVAPVCADPSDTGVVVTVCGCDGKVHVYDGAGAREPFASQTELYEEGAACVDAGVDAAIDAGPETEASIDAEVGSCGAGKHVAYTTAGCSAAPTCLPDGPEDACASTFCGCDGVTFFGACGYSPKPFAATGACADAGSSP